MRRRGDVLVTLVVVSGDEAVVAQSVKVLVQNGFPDVLVVLLSH